MTRALANFQRAWALMVEPRLTAALQREWEKQNTHGGRSAATRVPFHARSFRAAPPVRIFFGDKPRSLPLAFSSSPPKQDFCNFGTPTRPTLLQPQRHRQIVPPRDAPIASHPHPRATQLERLLLSDQTDLLPQQPVSFASRLSTICCVGALRSILRSLASASLSPSSCFPLWFVV